ncbi:MAG: trypsin-like peptidase domain-containing protein [Clostridiales bacterium]|nr:trypsin-like peptidase domain-containing protein [Clostridiales bacterium]
MDFKESRSYHTQIGQENMSKEDFNMDFKESERSNDKYIFAEETEQVVTKEMIKELWSSDLRKIEESLGDRIKKRRYLGTFVLLALSAILGSIITIAAMYFYLPEMINQNEFKTEEIQIDLEQNINTNVFTAVARKAMPSVVGITTIIEDRNLFMLEQNRGGLGTGVIVDDRGYILTNSHVISDGDVDKINVILHEGKIIEAEVVWQDRILDLAVIKVDAINLPVAELGNSDLLEVGEIAIAIGNPLGLHFDRTLTQGVISGLNRVIPISSTETMDNLIQTDASINPGNSGGPLLNARGQVIGINTAKIKGGEGLGFAIPINIAKPIVSQIIEHGSFERVLLGVRAVDVAVFEQVTGKDVEVSKGVYIIEVVENTSADLAGLRNDDIIIKMGGRETNTMQQLIRNLFTYKHGDEVELVIVRNNKEKVIVVEFIE